MEKQNNTLNPEFAYCQLPGVGKKVFRMGVAGNYGIKSDSIRRAAELGVNYWAWGASFKKVTDGIRDVIKTDREKHTVAVFGWGFVGWQLRGQVEKALRTLKTDYLDIFKLGWLTKTSSYNASTVKTLCQLRSEGKIRSIGCSIHNRQKAGQLALDSEIDAFMIRYNAKHPGAEVDIFPHLTKRNPAVISYTALSWGQLIKPMPNLEIKPWPGQGQDKIPPLTPELCYRFALSNPNVHVVLTGPKTWEQLASNLRAMDQGPLSSEEEQWVREYGKLVKSKKRFTYF